MFISIGFATNFVKVTAQGTHKACCSRMRRSSRLSSLNGGNTIKNQIYECWPVFSVPFLFPTILGYRPYGAIWRKQLCYMWESRTQIRRQSAIRNYARCLKDKLSAGYSHLICSHIFTAVSKRLRQVLINYWNIPGIPVSRMVCIFR